MTEKTQEYLTHADECAGFARLAKDPEQKQAFLDMENAWRALAEGRARRVQQTEERDKRDRGDIE